MKTFLLLLILFAFLQSAFLPLNLILVTLIARSLCLEEQDNLFLAFFGGLSLSFLSQVNLGYWPMVLLLIVKLTYLLKKFPVSSNPMTILIAGSLLIFLTTILNIIFLDWHLEIFPRIIEAVLVVPFYFAIRAWEERFVVRGAIKLKV